MQEILDRRQKYLDELKTKQEEYGKLRLASYHQEVIVNSKYYAYFDLSGKQEENCDTYRSVLGVFSCMGTAILTSVALCSGENVVLLGSGAVAFACLGLVAWKGLPIYYEWKYADKAKNAKKEYQTELDKFSKLVSKAFKTQSEINQIQRMIKQCDKEEQIMNCIKKLQTQEKKLEAEIER